ncbi:MAG: hypothetical protein ACOCVR_02820, partial [Myxococcota bacterium]
NTRTATNSEDGRSGSATYLCDDGSWELQSGGTCSADGCTTPWGDDISHGESVTAYENEIEPCEGTCVDETRTCSYGTLSGSYTNETCSAPCADCPATTVTWGSYDCSGSLSATSHGNTRTATNSEDGRSGSATYFCDDGTWELQSGSTCDADGCTTPWGTTISHGSSVTAFQDSSVACGDSCDSQARTCSYGDLSGSYTYKTCRETDEGCIGCDVCESGTCVYGCTGSEQCCHNRTGDYHHCTTSPGPDDVCIM